MYNKTKDHELIKNCKRRSPTLKLSIFRTLLTSPSPFLIMHPGGEVSFRKRGSKFSLPLSHRHQTLHVTLREVKFTKGGTHSPSNIPLPAPPSPPHTHACAKPLIHPWVEVKFTERGIYAIIPRMTRGAGASFQRDYGAASLGDITRWFGFVNWIENVNWPL